MTYFLGVIPFPAVFHPEGTAHSIVSDGVVTVTVVSAIHNVQWCTFLMGVG